MYLLEVLKLQVSKSVLAMAFLETAFNNLYRLLKEKGIKMSHSKYEYCIFIHKLKWFFDFGGHLDATIPAQLYAIKN